MSHDSARLELARDAWRAARPSDAEVQASVQRVRRAMRGPRRARWHFPPVVLAFALVFGGALAYAAVAQWTARHSDATSAPEHPASVAPVTTRSSALRAPSRPTAAPAPKPHPSAKSSALRPPSQAAAAPQPLAPTQPSATRTDPWAAVDAALARGAERDAEDELQGLARSNRSEDRGKALLGLAQLAQGRGDCARVRALVDELATTPGTADLLRRGQRLVQHCQAPSHQ